jgi:DNA-binding response OmpR family regulator
VRASPTLAFSSFLLLTAAEHTDWWTVGLRVGADDFMVKPFRPPELLARVHSLVTLYSVRMKLKLEKEARERAEAELTAAREDLARLQQELESPREAEEQGRGPDSDIRLEAQLSEALSPPLNSITQSIQQLMDTIHELEKPDGDERIRRKAVRAARTGYAQGLNELDRIRILLQDDTKNSPVPGAG